MAAAVAGPMPLTRNNCVSLALKIASASCANACSKLPRAAAVNDGKVASATWDGAGHFVCDAPLIPAGARPELWAR